MTMPTRSNQQDAPAPQDKKTPASDMQAEDAGTAESGAEGPATESESAMKQTSKTDAERGTPPR